MKKNIIAVLFGLSAAALFLAVAEGVSSLLRGDQPGVSLSYRAYDRMRGLFGATQRPGDIGVDIVWDERDFETLIPSFRKEGVGIGNLPYEELVTDDAAMNYREDGCLRQKPNLNKITTYIRTIRFNPLNPPNAFFDAEREISPDIAAFLRRYAVKNNELHSNEHGERLTLPRVTSDRKALVAGDSVAHGAGISDTETLASRLQSLDTSVQYVNIGVGGAETRDIVCNLKKAGERYSGRIDKLIYVFCENDFKTDEPLGTPEEAIGSISEFVQAQGIEDVTIVFSPYIFNIFPETTRIKGLRGWDHEYHVAEKAQLRQLARQSGFKWVDIADLGREAVKEQGSIFAGLPLFTDIVHLSAEGTRRLAERILVAE